MPQFSTTNCEKLTFQSSVVTSLLLSLALPLKCFNTATFAGSLCTLDLQLPSAMVQILAVESPDLYKGIQIKKIKV